MVYRGANQRHPTRSPAESMCMIRLRVSEAAGDNGTHVMMFGCATRRKVATLQS
jgi:hypothetical protein